MHLPPSFDNIEEYAKSASLLLLEEEKWIYEIHPYDIFRKEASFILTENGFDSSWRQYLENTELDECLDTLSSLMLLGHDEHEMSSLFPSLPSSFIGLVSACRKHWLPHPTERIPPDTSADCTKKGMSVKKLHEVKILTKFITQLCQKLQLDTVCDFGSGLGYLSHEVSKELKVIAIEADGARTAAAQKRTERLSRREGYPDLLNNITHVTQFLTTENADQVFSQSIPSSSEGEESGVLLTGLHACGDLSAKTMLDLFKKTPAIKAVVSVGCCYHLIQTDNFPQSVTLKELSLKVDKRALRLGCHTFVGFDKKRVIGLWKSQLMRAITEIEGRIVMDEGDGLLGNLDRLEKKHKLSHSDISLQEMEKGLKNIALLSVIRCHLGPVVEGLVLLDRFLYLKAFYPSTTSLVPLFDPFISPRNHAVVCVKPEMIVREA